MDQALLVFVTVVERESFSRAAEALHMTQPAVSQYIQTLEQTYGTKLLERSNKFVRLNKAGEIVYFHAKEILGLYSKMQGLMEDLVNRASGTLSIGASYTFGEYVLPHLIAELRKNFPLIKPTVVIGNTQHIADLVLRHQLDVGIVEGKLEHEILSVTPFAQDEMVIVSAVNHRFSRMKGNMDHGELEKEMWLVREVGSGTREATEEMFRQQGISPENKMEFGSTQLIKESVESGLGLSYLSRLAIRKELMMNLLHIIETKEPPLKRNFSILLNSSFQTKAVEVFVKLVKEKKGFWNQ